MFDVKHYRTHEARIVSDGNLTSVPLSSVCSRMSSLRGIRLVMYVAELNLLKSWGVCTGNIHLEVFTKDR